MSWHGAPARGGETGVGRRPRNYLRVRRSNTRQILEIGDERSVFRSERRLRRRNLFGRAVRRGAPPPSEFIGDGRLVFRSERRLRRRNLFGGRFGRGQSPPPSSLGLSPRSRSFDGTPPARVGGLADRRCQNRTEFPTELPATR